MGGGGLLYRYVCTGMSGGGGSSLPVCMYGGECVCVCVCVCVCAEGGDECMLMPGWCVSGGGGGGW